MHDRMIGGCICLRLCMCFWICSCAWGFHAHANPTSHTQTHTHTNVHMCLSMAGNLSAFLSISGARAQWDINYNMQQHHLYKSQWMGGITFLIKFPWLIVIKVSSLNVSSWLSNSGPETVSTSLVIGGLDRVRGVWGREGVWRTYWDTNSSWAHWQPSHNWQLWNTIISVIYLRIHQRLHRPVKTFIERQRRGERGREGDTRGEEVSLIKWDFYFIHQVVHITLLYCERIILFGVFLC